MQDDESRIVGPWARPLRTRTSALPDNGAGHSQWPRKARQLLLDPDRGADFIRVPLDQFADDLDLRATRGTLCKLDERRSASTRSGCPVGLSQLLYTVQRRLRTPDVIIDFLSEDETLFLAVENIGDGPAHQISVSFDPDVSGIHGTTVISDLPLFQRLSFLPPGKEMRTPLDPAEQYFGRGAPTRIETVVQFESDSGAVLTRSIEHDLSVYRAPTYSSHH